MPRAGLGTEAVVAAAARVADADGYEAVTLARLAAELGVRSPSLYAHVDGLDDVRRRLGARAAVELGDALGRAIEGRAGVNALHALAHAYRDYARSHPGSYAASQRSRDLQDAAATAAAGEAAVRVALAALREYGLESDDAVHAVRMLRVALHGFVSLEAEGGFAMAQPPDETFERLIALVDAGLRQSAT